MMILKLIINFTIKLMQKNFQLKKIMFKRKLVKKNKINRKKINKKLEPKST